MEPCEIEFVGEQTEIGIIPNFNFDAIHLISGSIGPFRAGLPVKTPLWLAIHLRKQQKCRIVPPDWMELEILEELKEEEKRSRFFIKMPCEHYMIVAQLILSTAREDIPRSSEIRTVIKDIFDIRESKLRTSIDTFIKGEGTYAKLDNLTMFEIHAVRPLLPHALDHIARYQRMADVAQRDLSMIGLSSSIGTGIGSHVNNSFSSQ
ncbi:probable DNA replication complex GINS protein PSF2 [Condylostylus longicornis]|uniref:probable DNA replication complex GINS protein PSF2 n=1 Tax=Condylostylus longicornis TaxID=2530218 RepID=UPI00244E37F4|nr:probable DNA replication complex GINS protein PSF2 [Condylostylus longicornis]